MLVKIILVFLLVMALVAWSQAAVPIGHAAPGPPEGGACPACKRPMIGKTCPCKEKT